MARIEQTYDPHIRISFHVCDQDSYPRETYELERLPVAIPYFVPPPLPFSLSNSFLNTALYSEENIIKEKVFSRYQVFLDDYFWLQMGTVRSILEKSVSKYFKGRPPWGLQEIMSSVKPQIIERTIERYLDVSQFMNKSPFSTQQATIKSILKLRGATELDHSNQTRALCNQDSKQALQNVQSPLIPVGFVTADACPLRSFQWHMNASDVNPRHVMIYFDLRNHTFLVVWHKVPQVSHRPIITYPPPKPAIYLDDLTHDEVYQLFGTNDLKQPELKRRRKPPRELSTRIHNNNLFHEERQELCFSLESFEKRYRAKVPLHIEDEEVPICTTTLAEEGVSYDLAVYSIIRHWLHLHHKSFSQILGVSTLMSNGNYLECKEFPYVRGLITNTFRQGRTQTTPLFEDLSDNLESDLSDAEIYAQDC